MIAAVQSCTSFSGIKNINPAAVKRTVFNVNEHSPKGLTQNPLRNYTSIMFNKKEKYASGLIAGTALNCFVEYLSKYTSASSPSFAGIMATMPC